MQTPGMADRAFHKVTPALAARVDSWTDLGNELPGRWRAKRLINWANGTSAFGYCLAKAGRAEFSAGPRGLIFATNYKFTWLGFGAFTMGNVIITNNGPAYFDNEALLRHEEIHSWQYVAVGPFYAPLYGLACAVSYLRTGDRGAANFFEQQAGLSIGGYPVIDPQPLRRGLAKQLRSVGPRLMARFAAPPRHYRAQPS